MNSEIQNFIISALTAINPDIGGPIDFYYTTQQDHDENVFALGVLIIQAGQPVSNQNIYSQVGLNERARYFGNSPHEVTAPDAIILPIAAPPPHHQTCHPNVAAEEAIWAATEELRQALKAIHAAVNAVHSKILFTYAVGDAYANGHFLAHAYDTKCGGWKGSITPQKIQLADGNVVAIDSIERLLYQYGFNAEPLDYSREIRQARHRWLHHSHTVDGQPAEVSLIWSDRHKVYTHNPVGVILNSLTAAEQAERLHMDYIRSLPTGHQSKQGPSTAATS